MRGSEIGRCGWDQSVGGVRMGWVEEAWAGGEGGEVCWADSGITSVK